MMRSILENALISAEVIAIYYKISDTESFLVGRVVLVGETEVLLTAINPDAGVDGFCLCKIHAIYRIEQKSQYLEHIDSKLICMPTDEKCLGDPWKCFLSQTWNTQNRLICYSSNAKNVKRGVLLSFSMDSIVIRKQRNNGLYGREMQIKRNRIIMIANDKGN